MVKCPIPFAEFLGGCRSTTLLSETAQACDAFSAKER